MYQNFIMKLAIFFCKSFSQYIILMSKNKFWEANLIYDGTKPPFSPRVAAVLEVPVIRFYPDMERGGSVGCLVGKWRAEG